MAKTIKPLTATQVEAAKPKDKDYNLFDGDGLYLRIRPTGTKTWVFRYKTSLDKIHKMTIGNYPEIKLAFARDKRTEYRRYLAEGVDLKELLGLGEKGKEDNSLECISRAWLTKYAVRKPLEEHTKHKRLRKLENHLFPKIGHIPITDIRPRDLRIVLNTIFEKSADNAQRIRSDLILIFSYAVQYGHIEVNHAREMESLDLNAPKRHRPALALKQLPELIQRIKSDTGYALTKLCILLSLHIFIRSSEIRFARWSEIDFKNKQWTLPANRTEVRGAKHSDRGSKMRTPHIIPLSDQAIAILKEVHSHSESSGYIFPSSHNAVTFISENTFNKALQRMGYNTQSDICFHGFRAMARSALGECGLFQKDAIEKQMSHQERNNVVGA